VDVGLLLVLFLFLLMGVFRLFFRPSRVGSVLVFIVFYLGGGVAMFIPLFFILRLFLSIFLFVWVRGNIPRFRYDKLIYLAWKRFLPLSLTYFWQLNFVRRWHVIFVGSQKAVCSASSSRRLEFSGGSYNFEKLLHSCLHSVDWLNKMCQAPDGSCVLSMSCSREDGIDV